MVFFFVDLVVVEIGVIDFGDWYQISSCVYQYEVIVLVLFSVNGKVKCISFRQFKIFGLFVIISGLGYQGIILGILRI